MNFARRFASRSATLPISLTLGGGAVWALQNSSSPSFLFIEPVYAKEGSVDLPKVRQAIVDLIEQDAETRGDGTSLAGTFIRLAWHCAGTYDARADAYGCNGARMRFHPEANYEANAGLKIPREFLESIKQQFHGLSYADLYAYAGVVAVEESGGPKIPFRLGRVDYENGDSSNPECGLPDADKGSQKATAQHIRDVFYRIGFSDKEIVALIGAHAMGRCHTDRSGYWGPWTNAETTFSNEYFRLLTEERWSPKISHNGQPWTGPDQFEDASGKLMMLPSDIALISDPDFRKYVELYAKDEGKFFEDFASAFSRLLELGVTFPRPWYKVW